MARMEPHQEWRVRQVGGMVVAGVSGPGKTALPEAYRYAWQYLADDPRLPVEVQEKARGKWRTVATLGKQHG